MDSPDQTNANLFQQLGNIQGTLAAQNTSNIASFAAVTTVINEFKSEFRLRTTEQDRSIDELKKEVASKYVNVETFSKHLQADDDHESRIRSIEIYREDFKYITSNKTFIDTLTGKIWGIGIIAGGAMSLITLIISTFISHYFK